MKRSMLLAASAGAALAFAPSAWAQSNAAVTNNTQVVTAGAANADSGQAGIEEVVVQARKRSEYIQDVPLSITAVSGQEMQAAGVRGFEDLQREVPGFQAEIAAANPSAVIFTIRGQTVSDSILTLQPAVGVYVDGVYIPHETGLEASLNDIDHVEVLEGPQGTLFGKNTTGGAVQLFTVQPGDTMEGFVEGDYGSYNTANAKGAVTVPIVDNVFSVRVSGELETRDPLEKEFDGRGVGNIDEKGGRITALYTPNNDLTVNVAVWGERADDGGYRSRLLSFNPNAPDASFSALEAAAESGQLNPANLPASIAAGTADINAEVGQNRTWGTGQFNVSSTSGASTTITYDLGGDVQVKSITAYEGQSDNIFNDIDGTSFLINQTGGQEQDHYFSEEAQISGASFNERLNWVGGLYYDLDKGWDESETDSLVDVAGPPQPAFSYIARIDDTSFSVFGQATYKLTDRLNITGGIRWTTDDNQNTSHNVTGTQCNFPPANTAIGFPNCTSTPFSAKDNGISYLASVDYHVTDDTMVYVKTASSFRGGGNQDRGSTVPGSFTPFAPEWATDYEIGLKGDFFDHHLRVDGDVYRTDSTNIQESTIESAGGGTIYTLITNAAAATIYGDELTITALPMDHWTLQATMAQVDAQYTNYPGGAGINLTGQQWAVPHLTYSLSSSYVVPMSFGSITGRLDWSWRTKVNLYPTASQTATVTQGAYGLLNLRLSANIAKYDTDVAFYITNVADQKYYSNMLGLDTNLGPDIGYLGDPRIVGVQLIKHFGG
jgi:iron complex outermembrane receptor protein